MVLSIANLRADGRGLEHSLPIKTQLGETPVTYIHGIMSLSCSISISPQRSQDPLTISIFSQANRRATILSHNLQELFLNLLLEKDSIGTIKVHLFLLSVTDNIFSDCVNLLGLCLVRSGISLRDIVCATTVGFGSDGIFVDVTEEETKILHCVITVVKLLHSDKILLVRTEPNRYGTRTSKQDLSSLLKVGKNICDKNGHILNGYLLEYLQEQENLK
eukprot:snap_masked-scaffold_40-processed-gene-2.41-mRNA-1 protein AED:1.00 eAED:1.00 QI:0/0/0/0/1/1/2/0/217